jgi:glycosyltransferase involved in cell wall biosynthesis
VVLGQDAGIEALAADLRSIHALVVTDDGEDAVALALQAMSCGVPVIGVAVGTLSDVVADGVTGVLVPRAAGVTEALRSLLSDPMRRQSMGLAAVDRVKARFDTAVVGSALEGVLLEVVHGHVATAS